jgi:asparagine synthetase B (glutamine-hydrolysing)
VCAQPHITPDANVLAWNGEVFDGLHVEVDDADTRVVGALLDGATTGTDVASLLSRVHGPFAFIFISRRTNTILYGRDPFGRRSLLCGTQQTDTHTVVVITSVAPVAAVEPLIEWREVDVGGVYSLSLDTLQTELFPWPLNRLRLERPLSALYCAVPELVLPESECAEPAAALELRLRSSVERRVLMLTRDHEDKIADASMGVLFSGGLDSVVLAALAQFCVPPPEPIELINVMFETSGPSPDRLAAVCALLELQVWCVSFSSCAHSRLGAGAVSFPRMAAGTC